MNTRVGHIAHQQACIAGFAPSPSPSLEASLKDDANSFDDDEIQPLNDLPFVIRDKKWGVILSFKSSLVLRVRVSIGHFL